MNLKLKGSIEAAAADLRYRRGKGCSLSAHTAKPCKMHPVAVHR